MVHVVIEAYPQNMLRWRQEENQALMMIDISFGPIWKCKDFESFKEHKLLLVFLEQNFIKRRLEN